MLLDMRVYTCRPGTLGAHLKKYEAEGLAIQTRLLGQPVLFATTETGPQNSYVHIWGYQSAAHRAEVRAVMQADRDWAAYINSANDTGYVVSQENRLLVTAPFFTLPGR